MEGASDAPDAVFGRSQSVGRIEGRDGDGEGRYAWQHEE
jgi:hypothetical protein